MSYYKNIYEYSKKTFTQKFDETTHQGIKDIICYRYSLDNKIKKNKINIDLCFNLIEKNGLDLIEWCVDFLLFKSLDIEFKKKEINKKYFFDKNKYIEIWSFIYDFLKIDKHSGYDYELMSFLVYSNIMVYDISMRYGKFSHFEDNYFLNRELSEERKNILFEWATNAADDI